MNSGHDKCCFCRPYHGGSRVGAGRPRKDGPRHPSGRLKHSKKTGFCACGNAMHEKAKRCQSCYDMARVGKWRTPKPCVICGSPFINVISTVKTCSENCAFALRVWAQPGFGNGTVKGTCVGCGQIFERKRKSRDAGIYCSRQCAFADPKRKAEITARLANMALKKTGLTPQERQQKLAESRQIRREARLLAATQAKADAKRKYVEMLRAKKEERRILRLARAHRQCEDCGREYQPFNANRKYCSAACTRRAVRRVEKAARRARKRNLPRERVSPRKVFERDGWVCRMCHRPTIRKHSNTDDSPELDHIVPLAHGGSHTYGNTQLLCRKCNGAKGFKLLGDLDLGGRPQMSDRFQA
jgi:5-methylcytosine-specific restriction endonuclease McrA